MSLILPAPLEGPLSLSLSSLPGQLPMLCPACHSLADKAVLRNSVGTWSSGHLARDLFFAVQTYLPSVALGEIWVTACSVACPLVAAERTSQIAPSITAIPSLPAVVSWWTLTLSCRPIPPQVVGSDPGGAEPQVSCSVGTRR